MLNIEELIKKSEQEVSDIFKDIDEVAFFYSKKVLDAFRMYHVSESHFSQTTGYGYNDAGREVIEKIFANVLGGEDALVRSQFISGSHALTVALFAFLRPGDTMLSISGKPYDTLDEVIGITNNDSSLKSYNIDYKQIDLIDNDFDYSKIEEVLKTQKIKLIEIQRSKGYSTRKSITIDALEKVIKFIRNIDKEVIIMIDNCYCEFVEKKSPLEVGADVIVGSLIKNLGGGIAPNGAYIAGKTELVNLAAERLTVPGEGREVGPTLGINKQILQGLYMAPSAVASSLKTAVFVQNIIFNDPDKLILFTQGIQAASAIDSFATPLPWDMPGYKDKVIMASGSFTQGSSIEISCDGPIRPPYIAYMQGSLTYEYGKLALVSALKNIVGEL